MADRYCTNSADCIVRYECDTTIRPAECICDHTMMFYGKDCKQTHAYLIISYTFLACYALLLLLTSLEILFRKVRSQRLGKRLLNAAFSTNVFVTGCLASVISQCVSALVYAFGLGDQYLSRDSISPYSIGCIGLFGVACVFNTAFFWIEIAGGGVSNRQRNIQKSKHVLLWISSFYIIAVCTIYAMTGEMVYTFAVSLLATLGMAIAMLIGANRLSNKLRQVTPNVVERPSTGLALTGLAIFRTRKFKRDTGDIKSQKIIVHARKISRRLFILFFSTVGFVVSALYPGAGALTCTSAFVQLWSVLSMCRLVLNYIDGRNITAKASSKLKSMCHKKKTQFLLVRSQNSINAPHR